jgi:pimeloyl-ACP methyl ester carboxylesterase
MEALTGAQARLPRVTMRRAVLAGLILAALPGVLFSIWYVNIQCFPYQKPILKTPQAVGLAFETLKLKSADGVDTVGWYVPPPAKPAPAVLVLHGHGGHRDQLLEQLAFLHKAGFGAVAMDLRHHGESAPAICTFGLTETQDVRAWIDMLEARPEHKGQKIGLLGYSMGAVTALSSMKRFPDVAATVADSAFASLSDEVRWRLSRFVPDAMLGYAWFFTLSAGCTATRSPPSAWELTTWLPQIAPRPVFLIHGTADMTTPYAASEQLAAAGGPNVSKWIVEGATHTGARTKNKPEYDRRVAEFFSKVLN